MSKLLKVTLFLAALPFAAFTVWVVIGLAANALLPHTAPAAAAPAAVEHPAVPTPLFPQARFVHSTGDLPGCTLVRWHVLGTTGNTKADFTRANENLAKLAQAVGANTVQWFIDEDLFMRANLYDCPPGN